MMKLSNKKIKFIRRHYKSLSPEEIARKIGIGESDVRKVIRELHGTKRGVEDKADRNQVFLQSLIEYGLCILLLISPLIYYPHIENFSNLPKATFIQFSSSILLLAWLLKSHRSGRLVVIGHPIMIPLALWLLWSGASIFWSVDKFSGVVL